MRAVAQRPATHLDLRVGALLAAILAMHLAMPGVDLHLVVADTIELIALVVVIDTPNGANGVHHNGDTPQWGHPRRSESRNRYYDYDTPPRDEKPPRRSQPRSDPSRGGDQRDGDQRGRSTQRYDQDRYGDQDLSQGQDQREDGRSRSRSNNRQYDHEQRYSGISSAGSTSDRPPPTNNDQHSHVSFSPLITTPTIPV